MPSKRSASGTSNDGSTDASGVPGDVIRAADELLTAAKSNAAPLTKKSRQRIQKLGRQLEAARATEAKRLRQKAKAEQQVAKFERLAGDAAAAIVSLVGRIRDEAREAVGSGSGTSSAANPKAVAPKPRSTAPKPKARTASRAKASASAPTTTRAKAKPATATSASARKTTTTARQPATPRKPTTARKTTSGTSRTTTTRRPGTRPRKPSA